MSTPKPSEQRSLARRIRNNALLTLPALGLLGAVPSCSSDMSGSRLPPGTIVDVCPEGHTCEDNGDGTFVVVDNGGGPGGPGTVGAGGSVSGGSGGTTGSGGSSTGSGGTTSACTDVQHPDHQDKPCSVWAEWGECPNQWLSGYCDASCGRCAPDAGSGGTTGSGGSSTGSGGTTSGGGPTLPNITGGSNGWASRYWDCCKPHCAWSAHGATSQSCGSNGTSVVSASVSNACDSNGSSGAFMCYGQAPRAVSSSVSYGYIAVPNPTCGQCYHIQFTGTSHNGGNDPGSAAIAGKHMIVKVTNTGGDVHGGQFDLLIPGGGVGINPNTCPAQWGVSASALGPTHGGFLSSCSGTHAQKKACVRSKCDSVLPAGPLRDGCHWFVDWFEVADNPNFKVEPISCPSGI